MKLILNHVLQKLSKKLQLNFLSIALDLKLNKKGFSISWIKKIINKTVSLSCAAKKEWINKWTSKLFLNRIGSKSKHNNHFSIIFWKDWKKYKNKLFLNHNLNLKMIKSLRTIGWKCFLIMVWKKLTVSHNVVQ